MILDPNRDGIEAFYGGRLRIIKGDIEEVTDFVIRACTDILSEDMENLGDNTFKYKGETLRQYIYPYLDTKAMGRAYADLFGKIGFEFEELDIKVINL